KPDNARRNNMAMIIAWETLNAVRHPTSKQFTRGFLSLRTRSDDQGPAARSAAKRSGQLLCQPRTRSRRHVRGCQSRQDRDHELPRFPTSRADRVIKGGRQLLQGRGGEELDTPETEGQMLQRVMPALMGMKNILVINDEAHHCYREKSDDGDDEELKGDEKKEAEKNKKAARVWISGLKAVNRKLNVSRVIDLSATPFFLSGSGNAEGTLFPWTVSDFSLMDAIECGIVKLPRVPVAENIPGNEMPMFRNLWENIRKDMPTKGRGKGEELDPLKLPTRFQTALQSLYGHYEKTFKLWE